VAVGGGHSFEGFFATNGLLLQFDSFNNIVDIESSSTTTASVTVQSGIRLGRFYGLFIQSLYSHGSSLAEDGKNYVIAGGTCPTVGVSGHVLCGGYGFFGREIGITSDQIIRFEVVIANGQLVNASKDLHSDLFFALRGSCSSAFGIIVSITFQMHELIDGPKITHFSSPSISGFSEIVQITNWFQVYAPSSPSPFSVVIYYHNTTMNVKVQATYMGNRSRALQETLGDVSSGFKGIFTEDEVADMYKEGSFLDAVLAWTGEKSLEDLISITSLPPLSTRVLERRKAKSILVYDILSEDAVRSFVGNSTELFKSSLLDQMEFKAYGGINKIGVYTDFNSPLLRGHLYEIHYGNFYIPNATTQNDRSLLSILDDELVSSVNSIGINLHKNFSFENTAYVGYIDDDLVDPGQSYFGANNVAYLSQVRDQYDPNGVLISRSSEYLYS
jgi:hypothetical protein